jgi:hypothetical protein
MNEQFRCNVVLAVDRPDVVPGAVPQRAVELGMLPGGLIVADYQINTAGMGELEVPDRRDGGRVVIT